MDLTSRNAQLAAATMAAAAVTAAAFAVGGTAWGLVVLFYFVVIVLPGTAVYLVLIDRFRGGPVSLLEAIFFANLLGLAFLEGAAWGLGRSGFFSLPAVVVAIAAVSAIILGVFGKNTRRLLRSGIAGLVAAASGDLAYLATLVGVTVSLFISVLLLLRAGFLVGSDTPIFSLMGMVTAQTGSWPALSQLRPFAGQYIAPGVPMIYATLFAVTAVNPVYLAIPLNILPVVLSPLGLYILLRRVGATPWVCYALPLAWMVGSNGAFFWNGIFVWAAYGVSPDFIFSLPAYIAGLILSFDLMKPGGSRWLEITLLAFAMLLATLDDQLTFAALVLTLILVGALLLWTRGARWTLPRAGVVFAPSAVLLPPYLWGNLSKSSPVVAGTSPVNVSSLLAINWRLASETLGLFGSVALLFTLVGVGLAVWRAVRRGSGSNRLRTAPIIIAAALAAVGFYLAFTPLGFALLGVLSSRPLFFGPLLILPVVGYAFDWFSEFRLPRVGRVPISVALAAVLVVASAGSIASITQLEEGRAAPGSLFTPDMLAAGEWLAHHAAKGSVVAVDMNDGNGGLLPMASFVNHSTVYRVHAELYTEIYLVAPPANLPYYYANLVMTDPSFANAEAAYRNVSIEYYVFQNGFSDRQIQAFSLLSYFALVYSNAQINVFQFEPTAGPGFVPATDYCSASAQVESVDIASRAYSFAFSIPNGPNAISSTTSNGSAFDGSEVTYCFDLPTGGSYTLHVHRYTYQTSEFLKVSVDGSGVGAVYFSQVGRNLGTPVSLYLPSGPESITLVFEGTAGFADPIDYLALSPA